MLALKSQYRCAHDKDVDVAEDILTEYAQHNVTLGDSPFDFYLRHQVAIILECVEQLEKCETSQEIPPTSNTYFELGELIHGFCERTFPEPEYQGLTAGRHHVYMAGGCVFLLNLYHNVGITTAALETLGGIVANMCCCVKLHSDRSMDRIANSIFHVLNSDSESDSDSSEGNISN